MNANLIFTVRVFHIYFFVLNYDTVAAQIHRFISRKFAVIYSLVILFNRYRFAVFKARQKEKRGGKKKNYRYNY